MSLPVTREERWQREAEFFDREAAAALERLEPVDPLTLHRYGSLRRRRFEKEFRFRLLGDLAGKRVLDVGCGDGTNAITLAKLGARVTGVDISPGAIAVAERRAELNGVAHRARFICAPLETAALEPHAFDIIWGDAILHHLIAELDTMMPALVACARPGALMVFGEPINLSPAMRRLRQAIPVHTDATPDERPLETAELTTLRRYLPGLAVRHFNLFARLTPFILPDFNLERASMSRRFLVDALCALDFALLGLPGVRRLGGYGVIWGEVPQVPQRPGTE